MKYIKFLLIVIVLEVVLFNITSFRTFFGSYTKKGTNDLFAGTRLMFLGIVASVFIKQDINTLEVVTIPAKDVPIVKTNQMIPYII